jgi:hypothetical protein
MPSAVAVSEDTAPSCRARPTSSSVSSCMWVQGYMSARAHTRTSAVRFGRRQATAHAARAWRAGHARREPTSTRLRLAELLRGVQLVKDAHRRQPRMVGCLRQQHTRDTALRATRWHMQAAPHVHVLSHSPNCPTPQTPPRTSSRMPACSASCTASGTSSSGRRACKQAAAQWREHRTVSGRAAAIVCVTAAGHAQCCALTSSAPAPAAPPPVSPSSASASSSSSSSAAAAAFFLRLPFLVAAGRRAPAALLVGWVGRVADTPPQRVGWSLSSASLAPSRRAHSQLARTVSPGLRLQLACGEAQLLIAAQAGPQRLAQRRRQRGMTAAPQPARLPGLQQLPQPRQPASCVCT